MPLWNHIRLKPKDWTGEEKQFNPRHFQVKRDGMRLTFFSQSPRSTGIFGPIVSVFNDYYEKLSWHSGIMDIAHFLRNHPGTSIDGELYVEGGKNSDVKTAIIQRWDNLKFEAFALPYWHGKLLRNDDCRDIHNRLRDMGIPSNPPIPFDKEKNTRDWMLESAKLRDVEGFVLKEGNYSNWYRIKVLHTLDVVVIGITPGCGKYQGKIGAYEVGLWDNVRLIQIGRLAGMTDADRDIGKNPIGRVCEITYQCIGSLGGLIHPRFIRWRDDKSADMCLMSQIAKG